MTAPAESQPPMHLVGGFDKLAARLIGGDVKAWFDAHIAQGFGDLMISVGGLFLAFLLVRFLYRRKVFLRF